MSAGAKPRMLGGDARMLKMDAAKSAADNEAMIRQRPRRMRFGLIRPAPPA